MLVGLTFDATRTSDKMVGMLYIYSTEGHLLMIKLTAFCLSKAAYFQN